MLYSFCNFLNCSNLWELLPLVFLIASLQIASKSWQGAKISAHAMLWVILAHLTIYMHCQWSKRQPGKSWLFQFHTRKANWDLWSKVRPFCCKFLQILFYPCSSPSLAWIVSDIIPIRILWATKTLQRHVYLAVKTLLWLNKNVPIRRLPDIWRLQNGLSSNQNIRIGRQIFIDAV